MANSTAIIVAQPAVTETLARVAPTITPVMQQASVFSMKVNPWFDWATILGLPFWIWVSLFFLVGLITIQLYWIFRLKKLKSVRGYVDALKKATQEDVMVWIISTTKNLTIECMIKKDSVLSFYNKLNITKWMHDSPMSVLYIGGKGGVIVSEDFYRTRDMVSEIALCQGLEDFNLKQTEYKGLVGETEHVVKPVNDYNDYENYGRHLLQLAHPEGLEINAYSIFDPNKFRKWFPKGFTATFNGGIFIRASRKLKVMSKPSSFWDKALPVGIMTLGLIPVIAAWFVPLG